MDIISYRRIDRVIFCELLSIKEPQIKLQNKETAAKSYRKMLNQSTKRSSGIEVRIFNCTGDMGMRNFGYLDGSNILIYFYFITTLQKKL